jgi:GrpB-like predicted nucleotidyltransferase (UPF0157 family)
MEAPRAAHGYPLYQAWAARAPSQARRRTNPRAKERRRTLKPPRRLPGPDLRTMPAPMTEQQIRAATVGEPALLDGPVILAEYDPAWTEGFVREAKRIQKALGARALRVEHVGSTAVPGLPAKPVIDILLVVANSGDESSYLPALEAAGYVLRIREPGWHQHRLLHGPGTKVNLHVFSDGSEEVERLLAFRDRLRANPADRARYAREKRRLASRRWKYVQNYADAKSDVIEAILGRARSRPRVGRRPPRGTGRKPPRADGGR